MTMFRPYPRNRGTSIPPAALAHCPFDISDKFSQNLGNHQPFAEKKYRKRSRKISLVLSKN